LVSRADVFLTTYLPQAREKLRLGVEELRAANPQLIYVRGSGWGQKGPEAHRPAYDFLAVWARSGVADRLTLPGGIPPIIPTGFFDFQGASVLAGATGAALFSRERTGEPSEVDVSLMNVGMWSLSADIAAAPWLPTERPQRVAPDNPVVDCYRTSDDRWLFFALLEADRYWPELVELLDDPDLRYDPRFATAATRAEHADACVGRLECIFASRTLEDWRERLSSFAGPWAHGATPLEIHDDEQALVNGFLTPFTTQHGDEVQVVTYPAQFNGRPTRFRGFTPEFGQQTEEILLELGLGWGDIVRLKDDGVVL
jgi:formyl-CoA transferase